jgi:hypothetical protein
VENSINVENLNTYILMEAKTPIKLSFLSLGLLINLISREFNKEQKSISEMQRLIHCAKELGFSELVEQMQNQLDSINESHK